MKKLLVASLLSVAAMAGLGRPSSASLTYPYCTSTTVRYYYYDCSTGAYCGTTDYFCDAEPSVVGCQTACFQRIRAACNCPPPGGPLL
jgi:hypothetical protein